MLCNYNVNYATVIVYIYSLYNIGYTSHMFTYMVY